MSIVRGNGVTAIAASYGKAAFTHTVVALLMIGIGAGVAHTPPSTPAFHPVAAIEPKTEPWVEEQVRTMLRLAAIEPVGTTRELLMAKLLLIRELAPGAQRLSTETIIAIAHLARPR